MGEILLTNIFFIITSVAVLVFTFFVCVILYHVIKILRSIRAIVDRIEEGSELVAEDVSHLRAYVVEGSLVSQIMSFFVGKPGRSRSKKKSSEVINE